MNRNNKSKRVGTLRLLCALVLFLALSGAGSEASVTLSPRYISNGTPERDGTREEYVYFGKYEHRLEAYNGSKEASPTPILWRVMELKDHGGNKPGAILMSHYLLESMAYQATSEDVGNSEPNKYVRVGTDIPAHTWDGSEMQKWLNSATTAEVKLGVDGNTGNEIKGFLNPDYFTAAEQALMVDYPYPAGEPMGGVSDRVTLPSLQAQDGIGAGAWYDWSYAGDLFRWFGRNDVSNSGNTNTYGPNSQARRAHFKGANFTYDSTDSGKYYWTRSPVDSRSGLVHYVYDDGSLHILAVNHEIAAVRPAFFLNLESLIFKSGSGSSSNPYKLYTDWNVTPDLSIESDGKLKLEFSDEITSADQWPASDDFTLSIPAGRIMDVTAGSDFLILSPDAAVVSGAHVALAYVVSADATGKLNTGAVVKSGDIRAMNGRSWEIHKPNVPVTGVTLNQTALTLTTGGTAALTAMIMPSDATDKTVTWTTSDPAVATVDGSGNVTAVGPGACTVTVTTTSGGWTASCTVTVSDFAKTPLPIDGSLVKSVAVSGNVATIGWLDGSPDEIYDLSEYELSVTYGENRFALTLEPDGSLTVTADGPLFPAGTRVTLTAAEAGQGRGLAHRRGAPYGLGTLTAATEGGNSVFRVAKEQMEALPEGLYDLTFVTAAGANPAFEGVFASGYAHATSVPAGPEIALTAGETASGGGIEASAIVTSGDLPQGGVTVAFVLTGPDGREAATASQVSDAAGQIPAFTLATGLGNGEYRLSASAAGYATVTKDVTVAAADEPGTSLTDLLNDLNGRIRSEVSLIDPPAGLGTAITRIENPDEVFSPRTQPGASLPDGYAPAADTFSAHLPLSGANGDVLAFSYTADLAGDARFAGWAGLSGAERVALLDDAGAWLAYEYVTGETAFATLVGEDGALSWQGAVDAGVVALGGRGPALRYAVTDAAGVPYVLTDVLVVPDGAADGVLRDPVWLAVPRAEQPEDHGGGGGGCDAGAGLWALLLLPALRLLRRRR